MATVNVHSKAFHWNWFKGCIQKIAMSCTRETELSLKQVKQQSTETERPGVLKCCILLAGFFFFPNSVRSCFFPHLSNQVSRYCSSSSVHPNRHWWMTMTMMMTMMMMMMMMRRRRRRWWWWWWWWWWGGGGGGGGVFWSSLQILSLANAPCWNVIAVLLHTKDSTSHYRYIRRWLNHAKSEDALSQHLNFSHI